MAKARLKKPKFKVGDKVFVRFVINGASTEILNMPAVISSDVIGINTATSFYTVRIIVPTGHFQVQVTEEGQIQLLKILSPFEKAMYGITE